MKNSITTKFISIVSVLTFILIATLSFITITVVEKSQIKLSNAFIETLKNDQKNEENLLNKALERKGKSLLSLLAQSSSSLILGYDFDTLEQIAKCSTKDSEISFTVFYDKDNNPITSQSPNKNNIKILRNEIRFDNELVGYVDIGLDDKSVKNSVEKVSARIDNIIKETEKAKEDGISSIVTINGAFSIVGVILLCFAIYVLLLFVVIKPIRKVIGFAEKMSQGDLSSDVEIDRKDETGQLLVAMDNLVKQLRQIVSNIMMSSDNLNGASNELIQSSNEMGKSTGEVEKLATQSANFSKQITNNVNTMASTNEEASVNLTTVVAALEQLSTNVNTVAAAAEEASANMSGINDNAKKISKDINNVSSSIEKMSKSLNDINRKSQNAVGISAEANESAQKTLESMNQLGDTTNRIGQIVKLIASIANQTNMLALNATIEAASAGDTGKGFAVVAAEVKDLAQQTSEANNEIAQQIGEIQKYTSDALSQTENVNKVVYKVSEINHDIAGSIEEQSKTANVISSSVESIASYSKESTLNVQEASYGLKEITRSAAEVSLAGKESTSNLREASTGIKEIARSSADVFTNIKEVNDSFQHVSNSMIQISSIVSETNKNAENLSKMADFMKKSVSFFKLGKFQTFNIGESQDKQNYLPQKRFSEDQLAEES